MTTIAIDRSGDVAVDSRITESGFVVSDSHNKHFISECKTFLFLFTGDAGKFEPLKMLAETFRSKPDMAHFYKTAFLGMGGFNYSELFTENCSFIVVERVATNNNKYDIKVYEFYKPEDQETVVYIEHGLPIAFGSGRRIAKGIMALNLPCHYALAGAMKVDNQTGGRIQEFNFNNVTKCFDYQSYQLEDVAPLNDYDFKGQGYGDSIV